MSAPSSSSSSSSHSFPSPINGSSSSFSSVTTNSFISSGSSSSSSGYNSIPGNPMADDDQSSLQLQLVQLLGPVRDPLSTVVPMTILYLLLLLTGTLGNICTCIVIARNKYMHTATNYYLFSLAVSDLLLLVLGIPQELFSLWQKYPYTLGEFWCVLRGFGSETSTNASILLISAFTVERFFAICNPLKSHTMSQLPRAIKIILIIWVVSALSALPLAFQFGIVSVDKKGLQSISRVCSLKRVLFEYCFETTAIVFFLVPITLISVLYILIGINLRRSSNQIKSSEPSLTPKEMLTQYHHPQHSNNNNNNNSSSNSNQPPADNSTTSAHHSAENLSLYLRNNSVCSSSQQKQIASRRSVIRMLVAVVIAFFVCYSPFHAQRVLASMMTRYSLKSQTYFFYHTLLNHISGITYYLSATMNPILYQVLSRKFRIAFRDTFGGCLPCLRTTLPEITYSNIVGGASSYKLSRTGSFYSNGSFRRSSFNFDPAVVPPTPVHKTAEDHFLTMDTTTSTNNRTQSEPSSARLLVIPNTTGNGNGNGNDRDSDSRSLASGRSTNSLQVTLGPSNSFLSVPAFKF